MRFRAILNREGGTLRTTNLEAFSARIRAALEGAGHQVEISIVPGGEIEATLKAAASDPLVDVVMAGGGDGTASAAAGCLMNTGKALAILPAGTMNLFARSLGIPLSLDQAVDEFATGHIREVDVATANGKPFVHQFSIGMHAKLVRLRDSMNFASRRGKIAASVRAAVDTIRNPPSLDAILEMDETRLTVRTTAIGVTNNLFGEGHLPYADSPDGGVLGIYITTARSRGELIWFIANMAFGRWLANPQVDIRQTRRVVVRVPRVRRRHRCVIDGELLPLEVATDIRIHPRSLRVLAPRPAQSEEGATEGLRPAG
jgi:diacylglycerol kinase family enzyme